MNPMLIFAVTALACGQSAQETTLEARLAALVDRAHGLQADEVAERTASTSPTLQSRRADVEAATARLDRALAAYLPVVQLNSKQTWLSQVEAMPPFQSLDRSSSFQATLIVPISDYALRITRSHVAASRQEKAAILQARASELQVKSDARLSYYEWARSLLQQIVTEQALRQAKQHLEDAQHAFEAGTASRADVARVEAQVAQSEQVHLEAQNLTRLLEERLRTSMHSEGPLALGEDLLAELPAAVASIADAEALVREAQDNRLEPRVLDVNLSALDASIDATRAGYLPQLNAFAQGIYANPNSRFFPQKDEYNGTWAIGLEATWTPTAILGVSADVSEGQARARGLEAQAASLRDAIRLEVSDALRALANARSALSTRARGLASAEEAYRVRQELFRAGRATSVELTDSETELTRAGLAAIDAHIDLRVAIVRFEHATGRDVQPKSKIGA